MSPSQVSALWWVLVWSSVLGLGAWLAVELVDAVRSFREQDALIRQSLGDEPEGAAEDGEYGHGEHAPGRPAL
jgi:hypothetical protein